MANPTNLISKNKMLLETGKYSDLIITGNGRNFKVHRSIVCLQSEAIAAEVDSRALVGLSANTIDFSDEPLEVVYSMVNFFYLGGYEDTFIPSPASDYATLMLNTRVYILAHKWGVPGLMALAAKKYDQYINMKFASPTEAIIDSLELLYRKIQDDDRLLKDIITKHAARFLPNLKGAAVFRALCMKNGSIGLEIIDKISVGPTYQHALSKGCPSQVCQGRSGRDTQVYVNTSARRDAGYGFFKCSICSMEFN